MAITIGTVYSADIPQNHPAASTVTISDISVPSDATACIFIWGGGWLGGDSDHVDISNFDSDTHDHFTLITPQGLDDSGGRATWSGYYLLYGQTGFPTRGSSGLTFTTSFDTTFQYGGRAVVFFLSGTVTDGTFIIGADGTVDTDNWTTFEFASLGSLTSNDLAIFGAANYGLSSDYTILFTAEAGQTSLGTWTSSSYVKTGVGYEYGEATPAVSAVATAYEAAGAFAVKAAEGGITSLGPHQSPTIGMNW